MSPYPFIPYFVRSVLPSARIRSVRRETCNQLGCRGSSRDCTWWRESHPCSPYTLEHEDIFPRDGKEVRLAILIVRGQRTCLRRSCHSEDANWQQGAVPKI